MPTLQKMEANRRTTASEDCAETPAHASLSGFLFNLLTARQLAPKFWSLFGSRALEGSGIRMAMQQPSTTRERGAGSGTLPASLGSRAPLLPFVLGALLAAALPASGQVP